MQTECYKDASERNKIQLTNQMSTKLKVGMLSFHCVLRQSRSDTGRVVVAL